MAYGRVRSSCCDDCSCNSKGGCPDCFGGATRSRSMGGVGTDFATWFVADAAADAATSTFGMWPVVAVGVAYLLLRKKA